MTVWHKVSEVQPPLDTDIIVCGVPRQQTRVFLHSATYDGKKFWVKSLGRVEPEYWGEMIETPYTVKESAPDPEKVLEPAIPVTVIEGKKGPLPF